MSFKNALCLTMCPEWLGPQGSWHHRCHRRNKHTGVHRVTFKDGMQREWADGDRDSLLSRRKP